MTGLLEEALKRVKSLTPEEQDAIAAQIMETWKIKKRGRAVSGNTPSG